MRTSFRSACIDGLLNNLLGFKHANCADDGDECVNVLTSSTLHHNYEVNTSGYPVVRQITLEPGYEEPLEQSLLDGCETGKLNEAFNSNEIDDRVSLGNCSISYFAGVLIHKCIKKFECHTCETMLKINKSDLSL